MNTRKFRLIKYTRPYDEFVPILKSASRPHSSTVPLPTLASSNLEALPLVGWAPRSAGGTFTATRFSGVPSTFNLSAEGSQARASRAAAPPRERARKPGRRSTTRPLIPYRSAWARGTSNRHRF